jgi:pyruvate dehydrogenase E2 component (dihydrolipoamide acetyltransferase)
VRKLARDLGVDLAEVPPTGPHGTVTRDDVHAWAARATVPPAEDYRALLADPSDNGGVVVTDTDRTPLGSAPPNDLAEERIPVRGVRRAISEKMSRSRREIPEATTWVDVDATALTELRARLSARHPETRITPLAIVLRAVVAGLRRFPTVNARLDGDEIVVPRSVHLGVAAQTDRGLVVPVIRDADRRSLLDLAAELTRLTGAARDGSVTPAELTGSTFTVTNYGAFGVDGGSAIINHPEAAILGVGRITDRPWVVDGALEVRKVCQLSIAFDHRIIDGGEAAGFLRLVADCVEDPDTLLATL